MAEDNSAYDEIAEQVRGCPYFAHCTKLNVVFDADLDLVQIFDAVLMVCGKCLGRRDWLELISKS